MGLLANSKRKPTYSPILLCPEPSTVSKAQKWLLIFVLLKAMRKKRGKKIEEKELL